MAATGYALNITAIDNATKVIAKVNKNLAGLTAPARRLNTQLSKFADVSGLSTLHQGLSRVGSGAMAATNAVAKLVPALGAIFGAASIAGIAAMTSKWSDFVNGLQIAANRMGTTAQRVQEMQMVAGQFGVSAGTMNEAVITLGSTMQDALMGRNAQAAQYFHDLGINIQDSTFKARTGAEQFEIVRQALQNIHDPEQRARIGATLLGGAYAQLGRYATATAEEVAAAQRAVQSYVLTQSQMRGADQFARSQYLLTQSIEHFVNVLSSKLAPILEPIIDSIREFIDAWTTEENMDKLIGYVQDGVKWLKEMWKQVNDTVESWGGWVEVGKKVVAIGIAAWAAAAIAPVITLGIALGGLAIAMLSNPVGLVIVGLVALGAAVYECWEHWDWIKEQFIAFWDYLKNLFNESVDAVVDYLAPLIAAPVEKIMSAWNAIKGWLQGLWDWIGSKVSDGSALALLKILPFIGIPVTIYENWGAIKEWFSKLWDELQKRFEAAVATLKVVIDKLMALPEAIKAAWNGLVKFFDSLWDGIAGLFDAGWKKVSAILDKIKAAINWISEHNPFGSDTPKQVESNTLPGSYGSATAPNGVPNVGPRFGPQSPGGTPAGLPVGPLDTSGGTPIQGGDKFDRGKVIHDMLMQKHGWSDEQAWGAAANAIHESGGNHQVRPGDSGLAHGLFQWHPDRYANFQRQYGHMPEQGTLEENVAFLDWETRNTEKRNSRRLNSASTAGEAGAAISRDIIRPGVDETARAREERDRAATATWLAAEAKRRAGGGAPMPRSAPGPQAPTAPLPALPDLLPKPGIPRPLDGLGLTPVAGAGAAANGQVQVNVNIAGAPPGTTATATTTGLGIFAQPPRVSAMPTTGGVS